MKYLTSIICVLLFFKSTTYAQITATPSSLVTSVDQVINADMSIAPNSSKNYVTTYTYLKETQSTPTLKTGEAAVDIQYFDGLGRPEETVSVNASPSGKDIVALQTYDSYGRLENSYLPYASATIGGVYVPKSSVISALPAYLASTFDLIGTDSQFGFSTQKYEDSPLNRVLQQGAPGADWQPGTYPTVHPVSYDYQTNTSEIKSWKYTDNADARSEVSYPANTLYVNQTTDEDQKLTRTYTDLEGKVVMKESYDNITSQWLKTRYCYDDFGLLRCVLQPMATDPSNTEYCFYYKYNARKLLTDKKVPGSDSIFMIYDARDRLVLTSDGNSRITNKWYYTKYDELNRPIEKGEITFAAVTRNTLVAYYKDNIQFYSSSNIKKLEELIYDALPAVAPYNDTRYRFTSHTLTPIEEKATDTKGLLVAKRMSQVRSNGISELALVEVYYYDKYGRVIQTVNRNYQGYFERTWNDYNFAGQLIQTRTHQLYTSTNYYVLETFYKYDHRGRLIQTDYQVDGNSGNLYPRTVASAMVYNEAGQLKTKYLYSFNNQPFLQKTDYQYNIRGWLTRINDPNLSAPENDLFGMTLFYNRKSNGLSGYWNGNIAEDRWGCGGYFNQGSSYTYDGLNRIKESFFLTGTNTNSLGSAYTYDKNGNFLTLSRWSNTGDVYVDNISYGYKDNNNSNRLDYTYDSKGDAASHFDFPGTLPDGNHYQYDLNGNMTRDDYRNYSISYNSFNLPAEVDFGNNQKTSYYYDGSGKKLTMIYAPGTYYPTNTEYRGQFVHQSTNGVSSLKYIITPEGRLLNKGTNAAPVWEWNFDLTDHLGNVRVVFRRSSTGSPERLSHTNYLPFGMKMPYPYSSGSVSNYLYNGKELQTAGSLEWYDYGARFYDPAIGRWHSVDPSADEEGQEVASSYCYVENNPISRNDPDGRAWSNIIGAVAGGGVELAGQAIAQMASGADLSQVDIDWVDVGAATIEGGLTSGGSVLKKVSVTTFSAVVQAAFDDNRNVFTSKSGTQAAKEFAGNMATAGVGAGTQKVVNASTKEAVSSANKQVVRANNAVTTAESRLAKNPNSPKAQTNLNNANSNAQTARNNHVKTQMTHKTVGQTNFKIKGQKVNVSQQTANTGANVAKNTIVDEKKR